MFARLPIAASLVLSAAVVSVAAPALASIDLYVDDVYQDTYETREEARVAATDWRSQGAIPLYVYDNSGMKLACPRLEVEDKTLQKFSHRGSGRIDPRHLDDQASRAIVFWYQPA